MKLGSIAAASTQTIKVPFVPEMLIMETADLTDILSCKVNVFGEGVSLDLPYAGLAALDAMGQQGNDTTVLNIPLANGKFLNKDCEITIVNDAAGDTVEVYGFGTRKGTHYIKSTAESYLANNALEINKFLFLSAPAIAAADAITVVFNVYNDRGEIVDTFNEQMTREDMHAMSVENQNVVGYHFNNFNQLIKSVTIKLSANLTVYYSRIVAPNTGM